MIYELTVDSQLESLNTVTEFVNEKLEMINCPIKVMMQIDVAIDELFGNIAHYAYYPEIGQVTVQIEIQENPMNVDITFIDSGTPFNPLLKETPNINLSVEERKIGGLGIHIVKKSMDNLYYQYKNGQNILTISKKIRQEV